MASQPLPTRFPCWCRAVYSWGGETDKDLGFVEGDLIECLNAGDGSWWMGRLRRDRRIMGLFPSNFVTVLGEEFNPVSRSASPLPDMHKVAGGKNSIENLEKKKEKAKARRPFQGYKTVIPSKSAAAPSSRAQTPSAQSRKGESYSPSNPPSTVLWAQRPMSRGPSRSPSPLPHHEIGSSPPPPPPPHRSTFVPRAHSPQPPRIPSPRFDVSRSPSPQPQLTEVDPRHHMISRTPSPLAMSLNGHTPPMIRDAMDSVMSSLDGMALGRGETQAEEPVAFDPWSPEAFEDLNPNLNGHTSRSVTSLGFNQHTTQFPEPRPSYSSRHNSPDRFADGAPHLETYVERMEKQLRARAEARQGGGSEYGTSEPPEVPPKSAAPWAPIAQIDRPSQVHRQKSACEMGHGMLNRTCTTKTNSTNSSSGVQSNATSVSNQSSKTSQSLMSGYSAGGFSATSAGSLARRNFKNFESASIPQRPTTSAGTRNDQSTRHDLARPFTPAAPVRYESSQDSRAGARSAVDWSASERPVSSGGLGGFSTPKIKKGGLWKKLTDGGKTAFASARSTIVPNSSASQSGSPPKGFNNGITSIAGGTALLPATKPERRSATSSGAYGRNAALEMGLAAGSDNPWVMSRRDINRSNTPGLSEKQERAQRCQMLNEPVIYPVEELYDNFQGDEGLDGRPVSEPFQLSNPSFSLVDKAARTITSLPSSITAATLATAHVCRPYRSDVQRLRAIFIWCAERISWDNDVSYDTYGSQDGAVDTRKVIRTRRGTNREVSHLVMEMCRAIGIRSEIVRGYLKTPGEPLDLDAATSSKANHWWNMVLVDSEWRALDASLASPTNPKRSSYSSVSPSISEAWYFLTKPNELCWTHTPIHHEQQHMVPAISPDTLLALPGTCPAFFRLGLGVHNYDTSCVRLERLEICVLSITVPVDVEVVAEVETRSYLHDQDGDLYEDADRLTKKRVLSQANWYQMTTHPDSLVKRYTVKALLPGDEGTGVLKVYAGRKGLMHSAREIIHPLALALPLYHTGENPPYDFVRRHPTPHATRQDIYVLQPQCFNLTAGETYVFCVRQHPASITNPSTPQSEQSGFDFRPISPNPFARPASALSMTNSIFGAGSQQGSDSGSNPSTATTALNSSSVTNGVRIKENKPAKLAVQSPSGKIIKLNRKHELVGSQLQPASSREVDGTIVGSVWESIVKVGERGVWRGLVLADRSARWCVWGEWECS